MTAKDGVSSEHHEYPKVEETSSNNVDDGKDVQISHIVSLEQEYHVSSKTYLVLLIMGLAWGTCTLANVGPSTTYSYAVAELGGVSIGSWVPNAGLFPLIGLQPLWVS